MESELRTYTNGEEAKRNGMRYAFNNSSMGSDNKLNKWINLSQSRDEDHVSSLDLEDLVSGDHSETNLQNASTSSFNSNEFISKRARISEALGSGASGAGAQESNWKKHSKATMRFDLNEESDSGLSDIDSDWEIEHETDESNLDIDIPEFPRFSPMSSADFDNLIDSLLSTYLPPYSVALQHEVSVQKLALSSLQNEHNKLLVAFQRSETRASALERKHAVSDAEIASLVEDKTQLQCQAREMDVDFEDLKSNRDECQKTASDERKQFAEILRKAGELESKGVEDMKMWKMREKELEAKIEVLMANGSKDPMHSGAKLGESHYEAYEDANRNENSVKNESDREESSSPTDSERNVIDWSAHHSWYSATTISIAEDFENRISAQYEEDPTFAEALKSRLQGKFSFILPFLEGDCETLFEDPNFTSTPQGSDNSSTSNFDSSSSQSQLTSSSRTSFASTTLKRQASGSDEGEKESPQDQRRKRRKANNPHEDRSKRRRLRCHFHAFCPEYHTQKTCMVSGWLNIHNLRGHYDSHHTVIRCNKCFQEFAKKTERNAHSKTCFRIENPPALDIIDCDKSDEIDESIKHFRTWKLENEEDMEMKHWITKYESEITHKTKDDTRELAKWYTYWRILFPRHEGIVPTPFYTAAALPCNQTLERWLEVFQSLVETKVEHNNLPPPDLPAQAEYYKDVIREVYNLISGPSRSSRWRRGSNSGSFRSSSLETLMNFEVSHSSGTPNYVVPEAARRRYSRDEEVVRGSVHLVIPESSSEFRTPSAATLEAHNSTRPMKEDTETVDTNLDQTLSPFNKQSFQRPLEANYMNQTTSSEMDMGLQGNFFQGSLDQHQNLQCKWCLDSGYINFGVNTERCFSCEVVNDVSI